MNIQGKILSIFNNKIVKFLISLMPAAILVAIGVYCFKWYEFSTKEQFDLAAPLINGVIGGVVTSILILIFSIIWKSNITPWFENIVYKDTKIEGIWNGVLIPYVGIEEIDSRRIKIGLAIIRKRRKKRSSKLNNETENVEAKSIDGNGKEQPVSAELILRDGSNKKESSSEGNSEEVEKKLFIAVEKFDPIEVRVEFKRAGHAISGEIIEIGGISKIHTYDVTGSFKNLILTGEYENRNKERIDRGGLSLMVVSNGRKMKGFFSAYTDEEHRITPFRCILRRQDIDDDA